MQLLNVQIKGRMRVKELDSAGAELRDYVVELQETPTAVSLNDFGKVYFYELPNGILKYDTTSTTPLTGFYFILVDTLGGAITSTGKTIVDAYETVNTVNYQAASDQQTFTVSGVKYLEAVEFRYAANDSNNNLVDRLISKTSEPSRSPFAVSDPNNINKKGIKLDGTVVSSFKAKLEVEISLPK